MDAAGSPRTRSPMRRRRTSWRMELTVRGWPRGAWAGDPCATAGQESPVPAQHRVGPHQQQNRPSTSRWSGAAGRPRNVRSAGRTAAGSRPAAVPTTADAARAAPTSRNSLSRLLTGRSRSNANAFVHCRDKSSRSSTADTRRSEPARALSREQPAHAASAETESAGRDFRQGTYIGDKAPTPDAPWDGAAAVWLCGVTSQMVVEINA